MDKLLNELFERLKLEGIHSQYSPHNKKIYISATRTIDIEKIRVILKKFKQRLSFIDSPNSNIIFENGIVENGLSLNNKSMLLTTNVFYKINEIESYLNKEGFSLGYYFPPVFNDKDMTISDWLTNYHIPQMNYYGRDLAANIRGLNGILPDGSMYNSINAPRMATGSDINRLLILVGKNLFCPTKITIKINRKKEPIHLLTFSSQKFKNLLLAIASLALKNVKIEFATIYPEDKENSEPILAIGYYNEELYDYKNWIIRTVTNEGATLTNVVSDYSTIREKLYKLCKTESQIECVTRYRGISRLEDILKSLSQNYNARGYLYRYERGSFSYRIILPENSYQQIKDNLQIDCSNYKEDIRITECIQSSSNGIPLTVYSHLIRSCS